MSAQGQPRILITGSEGLIGRHLADRARASGFAVRGLDLRAVDDAEGDVRHPERVTKALADCVGVVHLAAISRVVDAEQQPDLCTATNLGGTRHVLQAAEASPLRPWVIYASSREVYGQPGTLPVSESAPLAPVNVYGRSKAAAEEACDASTAHTAIVRFSNVYGCTRDHSDRVIPAFALQALRGQALRVDGRQHTFDFTHVHDTTRGLMALISRMQAGQAPPPIHFVTGVPTTLGQLADLAIALTGSSSTVVEAPPRNFDVSRFIGDPSRAKRLLDWRADIDLRTGLAQLIADFRGDLRA